VVTSFSSEAIGERRVRDAIQVDILKGDKTPQDKTSQFLRQCVMDIDSAQARKKFFESKIQWIHHWREQKESQNGSSLNDSLLSKDSSKKSSPGTAARGTLTTSPGGGKLTKREVALRRFHQNQVEDRVYGEMKENINKAVVRRRLMRWW